MKRLRYTAVSILVSFLWVSVAIAEPGNTDSAPDQGAQVQTPLQGEQIVAPSAGVPWKTRLWMWREIKKRAAASRNTLLREAADNNQNIRQIPLQVESPRQVESQNKP
jgi:hypothetical protein